MYFPRIETIMAAMLCQVSSQTKPQITGAGIVRVSIVIAFVQNMFSFHTFLTSAVVPFLCEKVLLKVVFSTEIVVYLFETVSAIFL